MEVTIMSLEKASIVWSAKQLSGMVKNGKINFDHIVQRSYVWERARKSGLIESMILGYPVPPIFAKRVDDGTGKRGGNIYHIMDGKQRLSTVKEFLNDEFALTKLSPVVYMDDELGMECETDISDMKFSELPESLQNYLQTVTFNVTYFDNLTKEEERQLFKRLNAGKPLSTKSRLLASCQDIEELLDIGSHKLFDEMLTDKARDNKNQVTLVMKAWCMMNQDIKDVSFESKVFNPLIENTQISEDEKLELIKVFNLAVNIHSRLIESREKKVAKKLYTETHLISLIPYLKKAVEEDLNEELVKLWILDFFGTTDGASVSDFYNEASGSGSAKSVNIQARNKALNDNYKEFFKEENEDVIKEEAEEVEEISEETEEQQSFTDSLLEDVENQEETE